MVLWQAIALAAVLSAFSAGIAIASRLLMPGPDGRPTASILDAEGRLGWPLWAAYLAVFALTVLVGARLVVAVVRGAIATRRRRAHHRMVVDLVGVGHDAALAQPCARTRDLRVLDVAQPLAYCLPGVRSRVVVSEGTLSTLADSEVAAILVPRASTSARPPRPRSGSVHRRARRVSAAGSQHQRAWVRCSCWWSCWPMTSRYALPGALPWPGRWSPALRGGRRRVRWPRGVPAPCCGCDGCPGAGNSLAAVSGGLPGRGGRVGGAHHRAGRTVAHGAAAPVHRLRRRAKPLGAPRVRCATVCRTSFGQRSAMPDRKARHEFVGFEDVQPRRSESPAWP